MTDLETMRDMLKRAGIKFVEKPPDEKDKQTFIEVEDGYPCFVAQLVFDNTGALKRMAAWE